MSRVDHGVLQASVLQYLQEHWPSRGVLAIQEFTAITHGWENEVYSFRLVDHEKSGCEDLILRIYPGHDGVAKSTWEFDVMGLLGRTGFPVPAVYLLDFSEAFLPKPFVIMERIIGPNMRDMLLDNPNIDGKLLDVFCQLLVSVHNWDWQPHRKSLAPRLPKSQALAFMEELKKWSRVAGPRFGPAFDWCATWCSHISWEPPCLTHGDFHPANILMSSGDTPFVIDWGGARLQDFRFDLAWTILLMSTYGGEQLRDLILDTYQAISGKHVLDIKYFEVVAALRRLISVYLSVTEGAEKLGMRPGAAVDMQNDLPHLERVYEIFKDRTEMSLPVIEDFLVGMGP